MKGIRVRFFNKLGTLDPFEVREFIPKVEEENYTFFTNNDIGALGIQLVTETGWTRTVAVYAADRWAEVERI